LAEEIFQPWRILECVCREENARKRLEQANADKTHPAANRNFELYREVRDRFEAITRPKTVIDTDQPLTTCIEIALKGLR
jgi:hypothetical protein